LLALVETALNMSLNNKSLLVLGLLSLIWGSSFLLIQVADDSFPPLFIATVQLMLGALVVYPVLRLQKLQLPRLGKAWGPFLIIGLFEALVPTILLAYGETDISSALAAILFSTMPIFTVLLGHFWLGEPFSRNKSVAVTIGFAGTIIVLLPGLSTSSPAGLIGVIAILLAAISKAFAALYSHRILKGKEPLEVATGMMITAAVIGIPLTFVIDDLRQITPSAKSVVALILTGVFTAGVAFILFFWLIKHRGPTFASLVRFNEPTIALLLAVVLTGATLVPLTFIGMTMILVCLAIMNGYWESIMGRFSAKKEEVVS
jgi:drug/metabolite transporter (DMT)-like permease